LKSFDVKLALLEGFFLIGVGFQVEETAIGIEFPPMVSYPGKAFILRIDPVSGGTLLPFQLDRKLRPSIGRS